METIKNVAAATGCLISIITLVTLLSNGGRAFIKMLFKFNTKELQEENKHQTQDIKEIKDTLNEIKVRLDGLEEVSMQQCRNTIKNIYYKYYHTKKVPLYERKTVDKTFKIYSEVFHGNSYASLLYSEICKWEVEADPQDLEDD